MLDDDEKKSLAKIIPVVDGLKVMESNAGWIWLKEKLEVEKKKLLDILLGDDKIDKDETNIDKVRGKILIINFIFSEIELIKNQHKKLMEE